MNSNRKFRTSFYSGCVAVLFILLLVLFSTFEHLELKTLDIRFHLFSHPESVSKNIAIAVIDDPSLQALEKQNVYWPWPRDIYAQLVSYFQRGNAKAVLFDVLFTSPDVKDWVNGEDINDRIFSEALTNANNVSLAFQLKEEITPPNHKLVAKQTFNFPLNAVSTTIFSSALLPSPLLQTSAHSLGTVNYFFDADGICRRIPLLFNYNGNTLPHLGFAGFCIQKKQILFNDVSKKILVDSVSIPLDENGNFLLWWYGKGGPEGCFKNQYYSIQTLLSSALQEQRHHQPIIPSDSFNNKYVIIGTNAPGLLDFRNTPFTQEEPYPGMEIYATMLSNLLQQDFLQITNQFVTLLAILFFSFAISFAMFYFREVWFSIVVVFLSTGIWIYLCCYLFTSQKIWLEMVAPLFAIFSSFAISSVWSYATEGRARRQLRSMFNRYLHPSIVKTIEEHPEKIDREGELRFAVIFFSDIEDYTEKAEQLNDEPKTLVKNLNEYFSIVADIIFRNGGFLDKYIGDAVMAMYGIPDKKNDDAYRACISALEIQDALKKLKLRSNNLFSTTRFGIHSGKMVIGNIGSKQRIEYTAIGDTVNIASRLEGANKIYRTSILISEEVFLQVQNKIVCREIDTVYLKGKDIATKLYQVIGIVETVPHEEMLFYQQYIEGLRAYEHRMFQKANDIFSELYERNSNDTPTKIFLQRTQQLLRVPPAEEWKPIHELT